MTDHPILFSGPMVRAILAGHKTQTRRVLTVPWRGSRRALPYGPWYIEEEGQLIVCCDEAEDSHGAGDYREAGSCLRCPYGQAGDRLWVRETWCGGQEGTSVQYRADWPEHEFGPHWRPSIHMPRWASRLTLDVLDVRVERLQDISYIDIRAEGVSCPEHDGPGYFCCSECASLRAEFQRIWDSINGKRPGCSWLDNPWVWRVEFRVTG